jgi:hypothetical protein
MFAKARHIIALDAIVAQEEIARKKPPVPRWQQSGFQKNTICDRCGFHAVSGAQILVYHMDGNLNNSNLANLRSVCLNCTVEINRLDLPWRVGDLVED